MRLLVSVRSASEVQPALAGGADIIDAKEPSLGSLGPVSRTALREIAAMVPRHLPLSVALGDIADAAEVSAAVADARRVVGERDELYLKLGLARTPSGRADALVAAAVEAGRRSDGTRLILVAYADYRAAGSPTPEAVIDVAGRAGVDGILLDTFGKNGGDLLSHIEEGPLESWVGEAARDGRLVALAGSLDARGLRRLARSGADVVGVRTAACEGGRTGAVTEEKVRALKAVLEQTYARAPCP
jgi:uncharacterized protein (UPF0264 family)